MACRNLIRKVLITFTYSISISTTVPKTQKFGFWTKMLVIKHDYDYGCFFGLFWKKFRRYDFSNLKVKNFQFHRTFLRAIKNSLL